MATDKKISQLPAATLPITTGVKFEALQGGINVQVDADDMPGGGGGGTWGSITGTLANQTDLNTALGLKAPLASPALTGTPTVPTAAVGTNTTQAASTAFVKAEIAAETIGIQDLPVSAVAMWPRVSNGCAALQQIEMATSLFNVMTLDFDPTTQEFCQFQLVLPRKWNNGTVTAVFYWTATSGSGDVQWGISGGAYSNDDALTVALGSAVTVDDTLIAANDLHITSETAAITLAGSPADADFLAFQISRNPASDTLTTDARLLGVTIRITTNAAKDA